MLALDDRLPPEVLPVRGLLSYGGFPVFSRAWLLRRTGVMGCGCLMLGLVVAAGMRATKSTSHDAFAVGAHLALGGLFIASVGPTLATLVRHRRVGPRESVFIVVAMLVGTTLSFVADDWVSTAIELHRDVPPARLDAHEPVALLAETVLALAVFGLLGGWLAVPEYLSELRRRREAMLTAERRERAHALEQVQRKLALLQARVEPHFLFNALASVRSLIDSDPDRARAAIDALAGYLRATIPRLRDDAGLDSTVGQQLDICRGYLELMRLRIGDRLSWRVDASEACVAAPFPPLVLVTLVENAVRHGVEARPAAALVDVAARRDADALVLTVTDDGPGLSEGFSAGVGLTHVLDSLRTRYGGRATFSLSSRDGRTVATVRVPTA